MSLDIVKLQLAINLDNSFVFICNHNGICLNDLEYKFVCFEKEIMKFKVVIPSNMIKPCKVCGKNYHLPSNFKCRIDLSGNPLVNLCDNCADMECPKHRQYVNTFTHLQFSTGSTIIN